LSLFGNESGKWDLLCGDRYLGIKWTINKPHKRFAPGQCRLALSLGVGI
jgi:hypothetical protein